MYMSMKTLISYSNHPKHEPL
ncbi:Protein of unknown function [Bacillus wiedmannii]|nr:Protein of unknown function [Bacillus wiedmannii]